MFNPRIAVAIVLTAAGLCRADAFSNVAEATADGYQLVYELDVPNAATFNGATAIPYTVDNAAGLISGSYDRVAYYVELDGQYVWTSFDAHTLDPYRIGVPAKNTINGNGSTIYEQTVNNLNVASNTGSVTTGTGLTGNIEFWGENYGQATNSGLPNGDGAGYDHDDTIAPATPGYGSMQVHNAAANETLFAYNRWGAGGTSDLGIGNATAPNTDWTFAGNANTYTNKTIQVLVRPTGAAPNVFADVAEASGYEMLYGLNIPTANLTDLNASGVTYAIDNSTTLSGKPIDRVAYYMELKTPTGSREWVYVSMDAFTSDVGELGLPVFSTGASFEQSVSNLNVASNAGGIVAGTNLATGSIEFWSANYATANDSGVPGSSGTVYDTDDQPNATDPGYGSFQVHNSAANQTLLAYNAWGNAARIGDVGIGNRGTSHPDWTFADNAGQYEIANLFVLVQTGAIALNNPTGTSIVQRDNTNHADVVVEGIFEGSVTEIQARAVARAGFGGESTDWVTIDASPTGGAFSSTLNLAGGWYDLEVRALDGASVLGTDLVQKIGVGEIFITAGQSNSANHGDDAGAPNPQTPSDERVLAFDGTQWRFATDPQPIATGSSGSPWPYLGDLLTAELDVPVGFVSVGWGGTRVDQWLPGAPGPDTNPLYDRLEAALNALGVNGARAVLWHQGESDAGAGTSETDYATRLQALIDASRTDAGYDIPWLVALASYIPGTGGDADVINGQLAVIAADALTFLGASTDDMIVPYRGGTSFGGIHFNQAGLQEHASRWFDSLLAADINVQAVPEPGSLFAMLGVFAAAACRRRRP